ncbi:hypothetical protein D3C76_1497500 [compost metagenome]
MAAIEEQGLALFRVAEARVAAFFSNVVGFGLDNTGAKPVRPMTVTDDFAQQVLGQDLGVPIEKRVGQ